MLPEKRSHCVPLALPSGASARLVLTFEPLVLRLRHTFGTSHSSSATRTNALFTVSIQAADGSWSAEGFGESGLPPKKPGQYGCYHADVGDCAAFFDAYCAKCSQLTLWEQGKWEQDPLDQLDGLFQLPMQSSNLRVVDTRAVFLGLLSTADSFAGNDKKHFVAGRSGLEVAVLSCWSCLCQVPFFALAGIQLPSSAYTRSFYTAALNEDINEMVASTKFGLQFTPCLKIKLDGDVGRSGRILEHFASAGLGAVWSIDANSAWDVDVAMAHLPVIKKAAADHGVYMVEQPFPLSYRPGEDAAVDAKWAAFRRALHEMDNRGGQQVLLYADESISNADDVRLFANVVDGVNVKLEKAGGIRGAIRAARVARGLRLKVWIGTMVSTCLGCTAAAQVAYLADDSDVDGGLLVHPDAFSGGFTWRSDDGGIVLAGYRPLSPADDHRWPAEEWGFGTTKVESTK